MRCNCKRSSSTIFTRFLTCTVLSAHHFLRHPAKVNLVYLIQNLLSEDLVTSGTRESPTLLSSQVHNSSSCMLAVNQSRLEQFHAAARYV